MHDSRAIAKWFIVEAKKDGRVFTQMELMRFVYLAHASMLYLYKRPLFNDKMTAMDYGTVLEDLYKETKKFGREPIDDITGVLLPDLDSKELKTMQNLYKSCKSWSTDELLRYTVGFGTPWIRVYKDIGKGAVITNEHILQYCKKLGKVC